MDPEIISQSPTPQTHIEPPPIEPAPPTPTRPKRIPVFWIYILIFLVGLLSFYVYQNQQPKPYAQTVMPLASPTIIITKPTDTMITTSVASLKTYTDPQTGFSFQYSSEIALNEDSKNKTMATLQIAVAKINDLTEQPFNFTKATALKDKINLRNGVYGEHIDWPVAGSEKVVSAGATKAKIYTVFSMLEVCDVRFQRTAIFYTGDYQVILNYSGPRSLIGVISNYLTTDMKNCNGPIWRQDSHLLQDLEAKTAPKDIQKWFDAFNSILSSIKSGEIKTNTAPTQTYTDPRYGYSFQYPNTMKLFEPINFDKMQLLTFIPLCETSASVCIVAPKELDTIKAEGFEGAAFSVSALPITSSVCTNYSDLNRTSGESENINGISFSKAVLSGAATGHSNMDFSLRTFRNNQCYQLTVRVTGASESLRQYTQVDTDIVTALRIIQSTFTFAK